MRRTLTVGGLSLALLAVAASTASAGSISPASSNFGRVLIELRTFDSGSLPQDERPEDLHIRQRK